MSVSLHVVILCLFLSDCFTGSVFVGVVVQQCLFLSMGLLYSLLLSVGLLYSVCFFLCVWFTVAFSSCVVGVQCLFLSVDCSAVFFFLKDCCTVSVSFCVFGLQWLFRSVWFVYSVCFFLCGYFTVFLSVFFLPM